MQRNKSQKEETSFCRWKDGGLYDSKLATLDFRVWPLIVIPKEAFFFLYSPLKRNKNSYQSKQEKKNKNWEAIQQKNTEKKERGLKRAKTLASFFPFLFLRAKTTTKRGVYSIYTSVHNIKLGQH